MFSRKKIEVEYTCMQYLHLLISRFFFVEQKKMEKIHEIFAEKKEAKVRVLVNDAKRSKL